MQDSELWPLDFEALQKGEVIDETKCRAIIKPKDETAYQIGLMRLKSQIEERFERRGIIVTVKIHRHQLLILTDAEASEHNEARQKHALKHFAVSHKRLVGVDVMNLDADQRVEHDRRVLSGSRYLTAIKEARQSLKAISTATDERPKLFS